MTVRTRFAPSPTGFLHVGGVRTALYSWLYARGNQGEFILRIEDTDSERSTKASVDAILEGMAWLGLDSDVEPIFQSDRRKRYDGVIDELLDKDLAYYCDCSKERLQELREKQMQNKEKPKYDGCCRDKSLTPSDASMVVRFKNPLEGEVCFSDHVYGDITIANSELDDFVIKRSDGMPTYNFAVVVDDADMEITHVIRGDDHINNTPRQINVYLALDLPVPEFAHLPMILGEDGKRLSKRHGAVSVMEFKENGYLPEALLNYLVRLGWSKGDEELFSLDEMIEAFGFEGVSKGAASFSYDKLNWLNQHYMKTVDEPLLIEPLTTLYQASGVDISEGPALTTLIPLYKERAKTLKEIVEKTLCYYVDEITYDEKAVKKQLRPVVLAPLTRVLQVLSKLDNWQTESISQAIDVVINEFELKSAKLFQPIRVAVTGSSMSPSIDETLMLLGQEKALKRLSHALKLIEARAVD